MAREECVFGTQGAGSGGLRQLWGVGGRSAELEEE